MEYPNSTNTIYQYYAQNLRLYSITTNSPTEGLQNLSYAYDNIGNITAITDHLNSSRTQTFAYDDLNRLTQAQGPYGPITYNYDPIGNMTYNSQVGYYTYGIKPHAVTQAGANTYTYDENGNMISGAGRTLIYDHENKPISINSVSLVYDGNGNRVKKGSTVYIERLFECSVSDCTKYIFANGRRVALKRSTGEINYYSQDNLGSTTVVTDATGAKVEEIYYYPYGATRSDTGSVSVNHKYTGQEFDSESNLYYYGARYYDPVLSKFISPDPVGPYYSNPQELNRYTYVLNNPYRYIDPTGNQYESYDPNLWVSSIYGPLGSFGSSISQLGSFSIMTGINFTLNINTSVWGYGAGYSSFSTQTAPLKDWIYIVAGGGGEVKIFGAYEVGTYYLVDPKTGEYYQFMYVSGGAGLSLPKSYAAQVEGGVFRGPEDPTKINPLTVTVSGFAAWGKGYSGQFTTTGFWGSGEWGESTGVAGGKGASIAGMLTYSWYLGSGTVLPKKYMDIYQNLLQRLSP